MKKNILVFSFAFLIINVFSFNAQAQENEKPKAKKLGFEFFISGNHNLVKEDRLGLGGGINFVIRKDKPLNFLIGIDYNYRVQRVYFFSGGHSPLDYLHSGDFMTYSDFISLPTLSARYNFGKSTKLFIELGAYADMVIKSNSRNIQYDVDVNDSFGESSFGITGGIGVDIPINKYNIIIKTDYKLGVPQKTKFTDYQNTYYRLVIGLAI